MSVPLQDRSWGEKIIILDLEFVINQLGKILALFAILVLLQVCIYQTISSSNWSEITPCHKSKMR